MAILNLSSPWIEYYRKLDAMFQLDPNVRVIYDEDKGPSVKLYVSDGYKADALEELVQKEVKFGKVTMKVSVVPPNNFTEEPRESTTNNPDDELILNAFRNNGAVNYVQFVRDIGALNVTYVVCRNLVVQYFNDSLCDAHGVRSTLFEDIARDVFVSKPGLYYCTDIPGSKYENRGNNNEEENTND